MGPKKNKTGIPKKGELFDAPPVSEGSDIDAGKTSVISATSDVCLKKCNRRTCTQRKLKPCGSKTRKRRFSKRQKPTLLKTRKRGCSTRRKPTRDKQRKPTCTKWRKPTFQESRKPRCTKQRNLTCPSCKDDIDDDIRTDHGFINSVALMKEKYAGIDDVEAEKRALIAWAKLTESEKDVLRNEECRPSDIKIVSCNYDSKQTKLE